MIPEYGTVDEVRACLHEAALPRAGETWVYAIPKDYSVDRELVVFNVLDCNAQGLIATDSLEVSDLRPVVWEALVAHGLLHWAAPGVDYPVPV